MRSKLKDIRLPTLMGNLGPGATVSGFKAILQSIDYSNFERFSNVANETSTKLHSSFLEYEVLLQNVKFLINAILNFQ